jgi:hypothetical protein
LVFDNIFPDGREKVVASCKTNIAFLKSIFVVGEFSFDGCKNPKIPYVLFIGMVSTSTEILRKLFL